MTPTIRSCIGIFACLALSFGVAGATRAQDASTATQAPVAASQNAAVETQKAPEHPSHQELAKEMEEPECPCMAESGMGMQQMGSKPGMMGTKMQGLRMQGMGMPQMGMMGMGMMGMPMMGMPMMHQHMMMMRMMARNPKLAGKLMQMHADMMRAVADVLTKYGKQMESGDWPKAQCGDGDD